jgi:hypothetical protein
MLCAALHKHVDTLARRLPAIRKMLASLEGPATLNEQQALLLTAAVLELQPDVIIDLGTGPGNSAAIFALSGAPHVYRFYREPENVVSAESKSKFTPCTSDRMARSGDLTTVDFLPLLKEAERIIVFWNAHGYDIAAHVLGHLMPLIADKPHWVICHDMEDSRYLPACKPYEGKSLWRGMEDYYANPSTTSFGIFEWAYTVVDQAIPIFDFCWRNDTEFKSLDHEFKTLLDEGPREEVLRDLGLSPDTTFSLGYFTLNETRSRNFPAPRSDGRTEVKAIVPEPQVTAAGSTKMPTVPSAYDPARRIVFGDASCSGTTQLSIRTEAGLWYYSVEFPLNAAGIDPYKALRVVLKVRVHRGRVGLGILSADRLSLPDEVYVGAPDGIVIVELVSPPLLRAGSIILRNAADDGASDIEMEIIASLVVGGPPPFADARQELANSTAPAANLTPLADGHQTPDRKAVRTVHFWQQQTSGTLQDLYHDIVNNCLRPNLTFVSNSGDILFETNEIGLKGDSVDPNRRLAVVWGDSVVFGKRHGWPCLLDGMIPGYQFLNGGIEGNPYYKVLERAVRLNEQTDVALNLILLGWHDIGQNTNVATDLRTALDRISNPVLATMPTSLNPKMIESDISELLKEEGDEEEVFGYFGVPYSVEHQKWMFEHILERNRIIRDIASERGLPLIDLFAHLASERMEDFRQEFFDPWHPRPSVYPKLAQIIGEAIQPVVLA